MVLNAVARAILHMHSFILHYLWMSDLTDIFCNCIYKCFNGLALWSSVYMCGYTCVSKTGLCLKDGYFNAKKSV